MLKLLIFEEVNIIEGRIDEIVNRLYGIEAKEEIEVDELEEEVLITEETEEDED